MADDSERERLPLLVLDLGLDIIDGVRGLDLESDGLACESLYENLHVESWVRWWVE